MNIVYTLNNNFLEQVTTSICSILENNKKQSEIIFYLLHTDISSENQILLNDFVSSYGLNRKVEFVHIDDLKRYFDFEFDTNGWSSIVLARLLVSDLLPNFVDKFLYLDGDTIVLGDLTNLYNTNLYDKVIAMAGEPTVDKRRRSLLNLEKRQYHNSGVLLVDLEKWRKRELGKQILEYYSEHDGKLFAPDQDAINGGAINDILTLSPRYNFFNIYTTYPYEFLKKLSQPAEFITRKEFLDVINNPLIIHYLGEERPWRNGNRHRYRDNYIKYKSLTPWKNAPMETGWELYFKCFYLFNWVMHPFPQLRYKIINSLIPAFMAYRKRILNTKSK